MRVNIEHHSQGVEFEGEANVIAHIDGKRYRLIEDDCYQMVIDGRGRSKKFEWP